MVRLVVASAVAAEILATQITVLEEIRVLGAAPAVVIMTLGT